MYMHERMHMACTCALWPRNELLPPLDVVKLEGLDEEGLDFGRFRYRGRIIQKECTLPSPGTACTRACRVDGTVIVYGVWPMSTPSSTMPFWKMGAMIWYCVEGSIMELACQQPSSKAPSAKSIHRSSGVRKCWRTVKLSGPDGGYVPGAFRFALNSWTRRLLTSAVVAEGPQSYS